MSQGGHEAPVCLLLTEWKVWPDGLPDPTHTAAQCMVNMPGVRLSTSNPPLGIRASCVHHICHASQLIELRRARAGGDVGKERSSVRAIMLGRILCREYLSYHLFLL